MVVGQFPICKMSEHDFNRAEIAAGQRDGGKKINGAGSEESAVVNGGNLESLGAAAHSDYLENLGAVDFVGRVVRLVAQGCSTAHG